MRTALLDGATVRRKQQLELAVAADERLLQPADAPRPHQRQRPRERGAHDAVLLPLGLHPPRVAELERAPHERSRALSDEDLVRPGRLLEARRDVDRVPGDE